MKKELVVAGVLILVMGVLLFSLSQISRNREVETLSLAFDQQVETIGLPSLIKAPLDSYTNYKFSVSSAGFTESPSAFWPNVNITDPQGNAVNYVGDVTESSGVFTSNVAGDYSFDIAGFVGQPYVTLSVFNVGSAVQTYYPYDSVLFVGLGISVIGVALSLVGVFWRSIDNNPKVIKEKKSNGNP
jgi:hypothetical protein